MDNTYSEVIIKTVPKMVLAQYAVISRYPETDAAIHMENWINNSGIRKKTNEELRLIGWDFPFISDEQLGFGMRGYVSACILPEKINYDPEDMEIAEIAENRYATLTIKEPHIDALRIIPNGYKKIFDYIENNGITQSWENRVTFEEEYTRGDTRYLDIYIPIL